jgi:pyruvate dehydrogenase E2 component (dihydrolipoamide acetyltransferase)
MSTVIRMPEVLAGSAEAAIQTWLVSPGQKLSVGVPLAEVETEKAIVEYASEHDGTVLKLLVEAGVSVSVGDPIAIIGAEGESVDDADTGSDTPPPAEAAAPAATPAPAPVPAPSPESAPAPVPTPATAPAAAPAEHAAAAAPSAAGERAFMSPLVRRLAKERSLDLSAVTGTGPNGRIVRRDIEGMTAPVAPTTAPTAIAPTPAPSAETVTIPHTAMRRAIARRLTESKSTVPHFYIVADCNVDRLMALRADVNAASSVKISVNDFVLKAAAAALLDVPEANAIWGESETTRFSTADIAVAVAIDSGLVTPVLRSVEKMTLGQIAGGVAELAERARAGRLKQNELEGGSLAVSNLGMYGVTEFSAIINPPQSAILAVGRATQRPIVVDGELAVGTVMTVTLSADHRVLDGALAAQWVAAFVKHIENPLGMLV